MQIRTKDIIYKALEPFFIANSISIKPHIKRPRDIILAAIEVNDTLLLFLLLKQQKNADAPILIKYKLF